MSSSTSSFILSLIIFITFIFYFFWEGLGGGGVRGMGCLTLSVIRFNFKLQTSRGVRVSGMFSGDRTITGVNGRDLCQN